jgi:hypothetical protein
LLTAFAGAAAVPVLCSLIGFTGWLPDTAGVLALLAVTAYVVLVVGRPVVRPALVAGTVLLAAVSVVGRLFPDELPPGAVGAFARRQLDIDYAGAVLLLAATAAVTVAVAGLPQFRRPVWPTALACVVALGPVAFVAADLADAGDSAFLGPAPAAMWWHLAPGFAATVLAGLVLVLAVSRADRWFLVPAGALLLQVQAASWASSAAGSWKLARILEPVEGVRSSAAFLQPGLRTEVPAGFSVEFDAGFAVLTAVALLGPALLAAGAARTGPAVTPAPNGPGGADGAPGAAPGAGPQPV